MAFGKLGKNFAQKGEQTICGRPRLSVATQEVLIKMKNYRNIDFEADFTYSQALH